MLSKDFSNKEKELKFDNLFDSKHNSGIYLMSDSNVEQTEKTSLLSFTPNTKNETWSTVSDQMNCSNETVKL